MKTSQASRRAMLGGTFNPPHEAHVAIAKYAIERLGFDEVIVMPTGTPPHKLAGETDPADRLAMARIAFEGMAGVVVSDLEQRRQGKSYTCDTVAELGRVTLLMGEDMFLTLENWHRQAELMKMAAIVVFPRPGQEGLESYAGYLSRTYGADITVADMPLLPFSSTEARQIIAAGGEPEGIPAAVMSYIKERRLYVPV